MASTRTILITGGTAGLGYHAAITLARQYPTHTILLASRSDPSPSAASRINTSLNQTNVTFLPLDLMSTSSIRTFVDTYAQQNFPPLSALLLNAGLQFPADTAQYTVEGIEKTFAVCHVGHALLFSLLQPFFAEECRIVLTSSGTHDPAQRSGLPDAKYVSAERLAWPMEGTEDATVPGRQRYASAKLANVLWGYALHRRFERVNGVGEGKRGKKWTVVSFDPGLMPGTGLAREAGPVSQWVWNRILPRIMPLLRLLLFSSNIHTPLESGEALAWLATAEEVRGKNGVYYEGRKKIRSSVDSYDEGKQEDLWAWTVKYLARDGDERRQFEVV
ncbi:hypothetical protein AJ79_08018 [Helicocarpus griseus UAMH5409]|uniref:Uncharacterized protein n=1 Tax=Helicocarpus griseus UAMH5409 TaxID=1447875 RepID=A0A2B7WX50_9EURO|nr:hypothetical protein AJ79_08018 [Helicocarpus griseus UAMH5409]